MDTRTHRTSMGRFMPISIWNETKILFSNFFERWFKLLIVVHRTIAIAQSPNLPCDFKDNNVVRANNNAGQKSQTIARTVKWVKRLQICWSLSSMNLFRVFYFLCLLFGKELWHIIDNKKQSMVWLCCCMQFIIENEFRLVTSRALIT